MCKSNAGESGELAGIFEISTKSRVSVFAPPPPPLVINYLILIACTLEFVWTFQREVKC